MLQKILALCSSDGSCKQILPNNLLVLSWVFFVPKWFVTESLILFMDVQLDDDFFHECVCTVSDGVQRKVVFMARTGPLVSQQFKVLEKYLPKFKVRNHLEMVKMLTLLSLQTCSPNCCRDHFFVLFLYFVIHHRRLN